MLALDAQALELGFLGQFAHGGVALGGLALGLQGAELAPLSLITFKFAEVQIEFATGRAEAGLAITEEALGVAESSGVHAMDFMLRGQGALAAACGRDLETATKLWHAMGTGPAYSLPLNRSFYHHIASRISWLERRYEAAQREIGTALQAIEGAGMIVSAILCRLVKAQILWESGETDSAQTALADAAEQAAASGVPSLSNGCRMVEAHFCLGGNDPERGAQRLRDALGTARPAGRPAD